jgi:radical SAM protein with 4Fe4S-binding SPASM domain
MRLYWYGRAAFRGATKCRILMPGCSTVDNIWSRYAIPGNEVNWFEQPPNNTGEVARWLDFREAYHLAQDELTCGDFPLQIDFELNSTCQMKCAFCTHGHQKVEKRDLGWDRFRRVIDEGAERGLCSVKLNYINEPLLNRNLTDYIRYAHSMGVLNTYFATNGLLLSEKVGQSLIDAGLSKIMISLDATTPATFLKARRSPYFEKIVSNIQRFLTLRGPNGWPKVRVNFLETPINAHESEAFMKSWKGVADMLGFQRLVGVPGHEGGQLADDDFRCGTPFKLCVVDSGGNILPCCAFGGREMPLGHVDTHSIHEAWNGEKMQSLRKLHRRGGYRENPICKHCASDC